MTNDSGTDPQDRTWPGTPCISWSWLHTSEPAIFEARRAIGNLTGGLRYVIDNEVRPDLATQHKLSFVSAAQKLQHATETVLTDLVTEAVARGVTWEEIGETLGTTRQAAHRRFAGRIGAGRLDALAEERAVSEKLKKNWDNPLTDLNFGLDANYWSSSPPAVALHYAIKNVLKALVLLQRGTKHLASSAFHASRRDGDPLLSAKNMDDIVRCNNLLVDSVTILNSPTILHFLEDCVAQTPFCRILHVDVNPSPYISNAIFLITAALEHSGSTLRLLLNEGDVVRFLERYADTKDYLETAADMLSRPECTVVQLVIQERAREENAGQLPKLSLLDPQAAKIAEADIMEVMRAYWQRDESYAENLLAEDP